MAFRDGLMGFTLGMGIVESVSPANNGDGNGDLTVI
jgi:hypothetical protein